VNFLSPTKHPRLNEAVGLLLLALTLLLLISLISYYPMDPSLNVSRNPQSTALVHNWAGRFGAGLADLLLMVFGYPSFFLPVFFGLFGWRWFRSRGIVNPGIKTTGFIILLGSTCALLSLFFQQPINWFNWSLRAGGLTGELLAGWFRAKFNFAGSLILLLVLFFISLFVATRFSFSAVVAWIKGQGGFFSRWRERWNQWQKEKARARDRKELEKKLKREESGKGKAKPVIAQKLVEIKAQADKPIPKTAPDLPLKEQDFVAPAVSPRISEKAPPVEQASRLATRVQDFSLPSINFLRPPMDFSEVNKDELFQRATVITEKCKEFDVLGEVIQIHPGPVVTTYEFKLDQGIKMAKIIALVDDLCLGLKAESIRIDRLPGKSTVGIEVPNSKRETIYLREIISAQEFQNSPSKLTLALGKDIIGKIVITDLARMPHLLIAGQTGSGKSVGVNAMIVSILYKASPDEVKFIMVDPKRLELGLYENIPHLLTPVVTEPKRASNALKWAVVEMENRYKLLATVGVRNIDQYNTLLKKPRPLELFPPEGEAEKKPLPYIVIFIDELADLMMVASKDVEDSIMRLAQMARAVGIHLILATQRPSVDVITGVIKANFPSRISFQVAQKVDSRTILDQIGAHQLLGKGDMLFVPPGSSKMQRVHAPYVSEEEIGEIVQHLKKQAQPEYNQTILEDNKTNGAAQEIEQEADEMYDDAVRIVMEMGKASTSTLQRRLRIGYGRAARLIDIMERDGLVGPADGSKPREILKRRDYFQEMDEERME
jgi:DNA segregation ATPase FtsK/SpoIIIE, S-DNA-T family